MKYLVRAEYAIIAVLIVIFYLVCNFEWYWLPLSFILFDISAVGYLFNPKVGAITYNIGHSLIGPSILVAVYMITINPIFSFIALTWLFHISIDRMFGFGLKHTTHFTHTHLGVIGKDKV